MQALFVVFQTMHNIKYTTWLFINMFSIYSYGYNKEERKLPGRHEEALNDNVSEEIGEDLEKSGVIATLCIKQKICSCDNNVYFDYLGVVQFTAAFHKELINSLENISLKAIVMTRDFDLIIDVYKYDLIRKTYK